MRKTYEQWKAEVDATILRKAGLTSDDLPDCPYREWYDEGVPSLNAATRAIRAAKE